VDLLAFGLEDFVTVTLLEDLALLPDFEVLVLPLEIEVFAFEPGAFPFDEEFLRFVIILAPFLPLDTVALLLAAFRPFVAALLFGTSHSDWCKSRSHTSALV
jgi:hypothetical protein